MEVGKVTPEVTQHQGARKLQALTCDAKIHQYKDSFKPLLNWPNIFVTHGIRPEFSCVPSAWYTQCDIK